jgi:uncharacterized RDD family membrane protein YckC
VVYFRDVTTSREERMSEQDQSPTTPAPEQAPPSTAQPQPPPAQEWRPDGPSGPRASFGRRFVALLVDIVLLGIVYAIAAVIFNDSLASLINLLIAIAYYTYFEGGPTGQTIGKKALGIRVIDFNAGGPIGYGRGFIRYIGRILSTIPLLLGYFWMLWDKEKQCWHDKIASTVVVPVEYYPVG